MHILGYVKFRVISLALQLYYKDNTRVWHFPPAPTPQEYKYSLKSQSPYLSAYEILLMKYLMEWHIQLGTLLSSWARFALVCTFKGVTLRLSWDHSSLEGYRKRLVIKGVGNLRRQKGPQEINFKIILAALRYNSCGSFEQWVSKDSARNLHTLYRLFL